MARFRALISLLPLALLLLGLPVAARTPVSAAAGDAASVGRQPVLAVPPALRRRAAVHVIVEMNAPPPAQTLVSVSPQLQSLLAGTRAHLLDVLRIDHARAVYAFHLVPAIAATVAGPDLP